MFRAVPHPHSIAMESVMTAMTAMAIVTVRRDAGICPIFTPICNISTYENVFFYQRVTLFPVTALLFAMRIHKCGPSFGELMVAPLY